MKHRQSEILDAILYYLYPQENPIQLGRLTKDLTNSIDVDDEDVKTLVIKLDIDGYIKLEDISVGRKIISINDKGIDFLRNEGGYTKLFKKQIFKNIKEVAEFLQILKPI